MNNSTNILPDLLVEFLEIAVHNVVKVKNLYPDSVFVKKQKYGAVLYQIVNPELREYIAKCMEAVYQCAKENQLSKMVICFVKLPNTLLERVVFDVSAVRQQFEKDPYLLKTERLFRSFFVRLHTVTNYLKPFSEEVTFTILVHTTESDGVAYMEKFSTRQFPWIEASETLSEMYGAEILPIETINTNFFNVEIYVEGRSEAFLHY